MDNRHNTQTVVSIHAELPRRYMQQREAQNNSLTTTNRHSKHAFRRLYLITCIVFVSRLPMTYEHSTSYDKYTYFNTFHTYRLMIYSQHIQYNSVIILPQLSQCDQKLNNLSLYGEKAGVTKHYPNSIVEDVCIHPRTTTWTETGRYSV